MPENQTHHRSTPDQILDETIRILDAVERGVALRDLLPTNRDNTRILHNTLLTILRHRAVIDWIIDVQATRSVRPRLRRVLHWGVSQLVHMQGLAPAAVTDTCVRFVARRYARNEASFVNALLRRIAAEPAEHWQARIAAEAPPAVRSELGAELHATWAARLAEPELGRLAALVQTPAPIILRLRHGAPRPDAVKTPAYLLALPAPDWAPEAVLWLCLDPAAFFASAEHARGDFYVQDPATLLAPSLVAATPGERVADLCAAPGGKALIVLEQLAGQGLAVCVDRSRRRLRTLGLNLAALPNVAMVAADAGAAPFRAQTFDAVLLDVPCSNTGVLRRRPDVRWHFSVAQRDALTILQAGIIDGAATLVKAGGRLVYSTCSIEPEENRLQVEAMLARHPRFRLIRDRLLMPEEFNDGAYAALLQAS